MRQGQGTGRLGKGLCCMAVGLLCLLLTLGGGMVSGESGAPGAPDGEETPGARLEGTAVAAAQSGEWALVVDTQTGFFEVQKAGSPVLLSNAYSEEENASTLAVWKNYERSQLIVYYSTQNGKTQDNVNSYTYAVRKGGLAVYQLRDGFAASYRLATLEATVWLYVRLRDGYLDITVPCDRIEMDAQGMVITAIDVLPFLGAQKAQKDGFMLVPDGSGGLIELDHPAETALYAIPVYGEDDALKSKRITGVSSQAIMPVYGMSAEKTSFFTVITDGEAAAEIQAYTAGSKTPYNHIYAKFRLRATDKFSTLDWSGKSRETPLLEKGALTCRALSQRVYMMDGGTGYGEMAALYRNHLIQAGVLAAKRTEASPAAALELYGAVMKKEPVLGIPINRQKVLTDYQQAAEMTAYFQENGAQKLLLVYRGATAAAVKAGGLSGDETYGKLGSRAELSALKELVGRQNLFIACEPFAVKKSNFAFWSMGDIAHDLKGGPVYRYRYDLASGVALESSRRMLQKPQTAARQVEKHAARLQKSGAATIFLDSVGHGVYADYDKTKTGREEAVRIYESMLSGLNDLSLMVDTGNAYTWKQAQWIAGLPLRAGGNRLLDRSVPFAQMVLCGYRAYTSEAINDTSNVKSAFLKAIETHSTLSFTFVYHPVEELDNTELKDHYAMTYALWKEEAAAMMKRQAALFDATGTAGIRAHTWVSGDMARVEYDNGVRVYVNYGAREAQEGAVRVPAMDFVIIAANGERVEA